MLQAALEPQIPEALIAAKQSWHFLSFAAAVQVNSVRLTPSLKGYGEHTCSRKQHVSKTNAKINFLCKKYCKVGIRSFLSSKGCEKQKPKPELQPPTAKAQFLTYDPLLWLSGKALGTYLSVLFACLKRAAAKLRFYLLKWLHWSTKFHQDSCPVILLFAFIKDELEGKVFYALN